MKFFFPPACAVRFRDLSTSKVEGKIGIRRSRPAVDNRVDRDARVDGQTRSDGTPNVRRHSHSAKALRVPKNGMPLARARGSDRGDPQSISGIDASCARPSLEHTAARFRDLVVLASTRARTTGVTRAREPRRFICGDALSSNRRSEARSGDDGLRRGRFETKGASAHRSQRDINAHIAPARSEARRLERHPSSSGAPAIVAFVVVKKKNPTLLSACPSELAFVEIEIDLAGRAALAPREPMWARREDATPRLARSLTSP